MSKPAPRAKRAQSWWTLAPWAAGLALVAVTLILADSIRRQERAELEAITRVTGQQIQRQFEIWFGEREKVLEDLASQWPEIRDETTYRNLAKTFLAWFPGFQALSRLDANGVAIVVEPVAGNESVIGVDLHTHPSASVSLALDRAAATGEITRSGILELTQGGLGFGTYTPLRDQAGRTLGFINGVFRVDRAFQECLGDQKLHADFGIRLSEREREIFRRGNPDPDAVDYILEIPLFDQPITMRICPSKSLVESMRSNHDKIVLAIGLVAAVLAWLAMYFLLSRSEQRRNARARRDKLERELQQARKMESIGRLAGGIAHDFNNYLTAILGCGELVLGKLSMEDPSRPHVELSVQAALKAAKITQQLLAFAHSQSVEPRIIDPNPLILETQKMLQRILGDDIELRCRLDPEIATVLMDPVQFDQILVNLALNARDAMPNGGVIEFSTSNIEDAAGSRVAIEVRDTGVGMNPEECQRIFEPFYSTKEKGHGTGLGLATCYGIVKQAGGSIEVSSIEGTGTKFQILLPACDAPPEQDDQEESDAATLRAEGTILLAEDEPLVRAIAESALANAGYEVIACTDGFAALEQAERRHWQIDLLLTDMVMPRMGGRELATRLLKQRPELSVLFMTGYAEEVGVDHDSCLAKPFTINDLLQKVARSLHATASSDGRDLCL